MEIEKVKKLVLEEVGLEATEDNIAHYESCDYLTINRGRDGKTYVWYMDEQYNVAADIESGKFLTAEEIEKNFC